MSLHLQTPMCLLLLFTTPSPRSSNNPLFTRPLEIFTLLPWPESFTLLACPKSWLSPKTPVFVTLSPSMSQTPPIVLVGHITSPWQETCFLHLEAPIQRVAGWDTPFAYIYEPFYLPDKWRCLESVKKLMDFMWWTSCVTSCVTSFVTSCDDHWDVTQALSELGF